MQMRDTKVDKEWVGTLVMGGDVGREQSWFGGATSIGKWKRLRGWGLGVGGWAIRR